MTHQDQRLLRVAKKHQITVIIKNDRHSDTSIAFIYREYDVP